MDVYCSMDTVAATYCYSDAGDDPDDGDQIPPSPPLGPLPSDAHSHQFSWQIHQNRSGNQLEQHHPLISTATSSQPLPLPPMASTQSSAPPLPLAVSINTLSTTNATALPSRSCCPHCCDQDHYERHFSDEVWEEVVVPIAPLPEREQCSCVCTCTCVRPTLRMAAVTPPPKPHVGGAQSTICSSPSAPPTTTTTPSTNKTHTTTTTTSLSIDTCCGSTTTRANTCRRPPRNPSTPSFPLLDIHVCTEPPSIVASCVVDTFSSSAPPSAFAQSDTGAVCTHPKKGVIAAAAPLSTTSTKGATRLTVAALARATQTTAQKQKATTASTKTLSATAQVQRNEFTTFAPSFSGSLAAAIAISGGGPSTSARVLCHNDAVYASIFTSKRMMETSTAPQHAGKHPRNGNEATEKDGCGNKIASNASDHQQRVSFEDDDDTDSMCVGEGDASDRVTQQLHQSVITAAPFVPSIVSQHQQLQHHQYTDHHNYHWGDQSAQNSFGMTCRPLPPPPPPPCYDVAVGQKRPLTNAIGNQSPHLQEEEQRPQFPPSLPTEIVAQQQLPQQHEGCGCECDCSYDDSPQMIAITAATCPLTASTSTPITSGTATTLMPCTSPSPLHSVAVAAATHGGVPPSPSTNSCVFTHSPYVYTTTTTTACTTANHRHVYPHEQQRNFYVHQHQQQMGGNKGKAPPPPAYYPPPYSREPCHRGEVDQRVHADEERAEGAACIGSHPSLSPTYSQCPDTSKSSRHPGFPPMCVDDDDVAITADGTSTIFHKYEEEIHGGGVEVMVQKPTASAAASAARASPQLSSFPFLPPSTTNTTKMDHSDESVTVDRFLPPPPPSLQALRVFTVAMSPASPPQRSSTCASTPTAAPTPTSSTSTAQCQMTSGCLLSDLFYTTTNSTVREEESEPSPCSSPTRTATMNKGNNATNGHTTDAKVATIAALVASQQRIHHTTVCSYAAVAEGEFAFVTKTAHSTDAYGCIHNERKKAHPSCIKSDDHLQQQQLLDARGNRYGATYASTVAEGAPPSTFHQATIASLLPTEPFQSYLRMVMRWYCKVHEQGLGGSSSHDDTCSATSGDKLPSEGGNSGDVSKTNDEGVECGGAKQKEHQEEQNASTSTEEAFSSPRSHLRPTCKIPKAYFQRSSIPSCPNPTRYFAIHSTACHDDCISRRDEKFSSSSRSPINSPNSSSASISSSSVSYAPSSIPAFLEWLDAVHQWWDVAIRPRTVGHALHVQLVKNMKREEKAFGGGHVGGTATTAAVGGSGCDERK